MSSDPHTEAGARSCGAAKNPVFTHVAPFAVWLLLMSLLTAEPARNYALRTVACAALLIYLKPWESYHEHFRFHHVPLGIAAGLLVFALWVLPESSWLAGKWPAAADFYSRLFLGPAESVVQAESPPFAPEVCGWTLSIVRVVGSCLVIAVIEEYFWRGFLYRTLIDSKFTEVGMKVFAPIKFLVVVVLFGLEHGDRWFVGMLAGLCYGLLMIKTGTIRVPVIAHVVTNMALGIYVLATGSWQFW
jgi:CAAX prenyl protease-like protein